MAIRACVASINSKVMRGFGQSRNDLLESLDRPALSALPEKAYSFAEWKRARVAPVYQVVAKRAGRDEIGGHYYSVPSKLTREVVDAHITGATVEIFHKSQRIACHKFSAVRHRHTTIAEHMPRSAATWRALRPLVAKIRTASRLKASSNTGCVPFFLVMSLP